MPNERHSLIGWPDFSDAAKLKAPFLALAESIFDTIGTTAGGIGAALKETLNDTLVQPIFDVLTDAGIGSFNYLVDLFAPKLNAIAKTYTRTIYMGKSDPNRDVITLGLGRIGIEIGSTDIGFGHNTIRYALGFTKRPITIPLSLKLERFPLFIPTGGFTNYEISRKLSFEKDVGFTKLSFDHDVNFVIPFFEFKSLGIPIPFIGIPEGFGNNKGVTILSFHRSNVPLCYISIGLISSWFRWPRTLGPGEEGGGRPPMYTIPDREEIDSMISEKLRLSNETLKASLSFHR